MKRFFSLILLVLLLFAFVSCEHNVYKKASNVAKIWRVGDANSGLYFETANEAINYIMANPSRALPNNESRTIHLTQSVLSADSDGIAVYGQQYVKSDEYRQQIEVPASYTGALIIDFGGYRYDFATNTDSFFEINGGDEVYIHNGQSVIYDESSHIPYALIANTETVTIDSHLIDDRRINPTDNSNNLLYTGENGHLKVKDVNPSNNQNDFSGNVAIVTDGTSGAILDIETTKITIDNIYTKYNEQDRIPKDTQIDQNAKPQINIKSGDITILDIDQKENFYNTNTDTVNEKAILNIQGNKNNTSITNLPDINEVIDKAIDESGSDVENTVLVNYTVTFNSQGGSSVASISVKSGETFTKPSDPTKAGHDFGGWYKETSCTNAWNFATDKVTTNTNLYAKWTSSSSTTGTNYTVTFNSQGGTTCTNATVASGNTVTKPSPDPTRTGYDFGGWYKDTSSTNAWNFATDKVTTNTTLYAKWTQTNFTVTFNSQGGTTCTNATVASGNTVTKPSPDPTKSGYSFEGWYKETSCTNAWNFATDKVTTNTNLYAKWTKTTSGTASVSSSAGRASNECAWVQLWENGPKWATFNVGSTISSYASATGTGNAPYTTANVGGLYNWGGVNEHRQGSTTDDQCKLADTVIQRTTNDTAKKIWGNDWQTPTLEQLYNLMNKDKNGNALSTTLTNWTYCDGTTTQYETGCTLKGWKVSGAAGTAYEDNCIFLPNAGGHTSGLTDQGSIGFYWSSNPYGSGSGSGRLMRVPGSPGSPGADRQDRSYAFSVRAILVEPGLYLNTTETSIGVAKNETLEATVIPTSSSQTVTWSSSDTSVATVNNGVVTGVKVGTATITATTADSTYSATCVVNVVDIKVAGISFKKATASIGKGCTETLVPILTPTNATNKAVEWSSSNTAVATVDANGNVTGLTTGTSTITVTTKDGSNKSATCTVSIVTTKGVAKANIGGQQVDMAWVQLWENGPKWATMNVGATKNNYVNAKKIANNTPSAAELTTFTSYVGGHYQWGGTVDIPNKSKAYGDYYSASLEDVQGTGIVGTDVLGDTAKLVWGSNWMMPSIQDFCKLANHDTEYGDTTVTPTNTIWTWCDGVSETEGPGHMQYEEGCTLPGYKVSGVGLYADNSIFIPAGGEVTDSWGLDELGNGYYWSGSSISKHQYYDKTPTESSRLYFSNFWNTLETGVITHVGRKRAFSIRAIVSENRMLLYAEDQNGNDADNELTYAIYVGHPEYNYYSTIQMSARVVPSEISNSVTWESSDNTKATVDQNGKVTAVSKGMVTITATSTEIPTLKATYEIRVYNTQE